LLYVVAGYCVVSLMVAVGLGFVIFVHELGHFLVAKLCGVKCDKFYLGFDIAGLKFCKFRYGETEYGIGILPLGGYVKMLGQEDNPAKLREELERAKQQKVEGGRGKAGEGLGTSVPSESGAAASTLFDPRSFLAQSVPKRMAIISAGVIMNVIFAFLMAAVAFCLGVERIPCVIGQVFPGDPAWQSDLRVGDEVLKIAGKPMEQFRDLQTAIFLGDIDPEKGVPIEVRRPGVKEPLTAIVRPDNSRGVFFIGVGSSSTTQLEENRKTWLTQKRAATLLGSVANLASPAFCNGDRIVKIDNAAVGSYADICTLLGHKTDSKIDVTVLRVGQDEAGKPTGATRQLTIPVDRSPMRSLGLVMESGPITAIQADSPAAKAGLAAGDMIEKVDGNADFDPMTLSDQLRRRVGKEVTLTIRRKDAKKSETVVARLREPTSFSFSHTIFFDQPVDAAALGVAYRIMNRVRRVIADSPAAKAGMAPGDVLVEATLLPPDQETLTKWDTDQETTSMSFDEKNHNWPAVTTLLQRTLPGTTVKLTFQRKTARRSVTLNPVEAADWFNPDRGFMFEPLVYPCRATNLAGAVALGGQATLDEMTVVYRFLKKLSTRQVSARGMGGPVTIVKVALQNADQGASKLLLFLTLLSANLAVINFLPIPLLDGGLMMFLLYEGVVGKPANERVQVVLTYIGLFLIIALMVWVLGLDFGLFSRR
jgi:regulator of sigma E protease